MITVRGPRVTHPRRRTGRRDPDVTIQAQVLDVLHTVQQETRSSSIIITHDLGVVAETADRVLVMYGAASSRPVT